ncbi:hypothetical protein ABFV99_14180 [Cytobacillus horneckiae]|uniref:hypothetical protein n=1 Tax=Cytobacillus horneckiae TaxID=549687 RepID=UPI0034CE613F
MARFPNVNGSYTAKGKTHTNLVISEGMAPAEEMIISRTNEAESFIYEYGPEGNQTVVLAKGKAVEVVGAEYDPETGFYQTAVRQAKDASENAIGVNHHNVYSRRRDGMVSTLTTPTIITRNYIEVPLFETTGAENIEAAQVLAEAMKFGAAVSNVGGVDETSTLKNGDRVVADRSGNFRKFVKGQDDPLAIIGQVWGKSTELPPAGFLQYYQEMINPEMEEFLKQMSYSPSPGLNGNGAGAYPYGVPYTVKGWKPEFEKMLTKAGLGGQASGIPFLTDGFFRAQEVRTFAANTEDVEAIRGAEGTTYDSAANKLIVAAGAKNAAAFIKLKHKIDVTKLSNITVQLNGALMDANDFPC